MENLTLNRVELRGRIGQDPRIARQGRNIADFNGLRKGVPVSVVGRIRNVKYTSTEGEERQFTEIQANKLSIMKNDPEESVPVS